MAVEDLRRRVSQLDKAAGKRPARGAKEVVHALDRIEESLAALHLGMRVDPAEVPYPERLRLHRFRVLSQHFEDGVTWQLLRAVGLSTRRFVELGCGPNGGNSGFLARELGFSGLMVDGDEACVAEARALFPAALVTVVRGWITREGVNDLIAGEGFDGEIDLLSIDVDGNDYWIWKAIDVCNPRLVIVESNPLLGPDRTLTIPYDAEFRRSTQTPLHAGHYGASLGALTHLATEKGYRLVTTDQSGVNAYFVRNDLARDIPACEPARAHRIGKPAWVPLTADAPERMASAGLPLVDVTAEP